MKKSLRRILSLLLCIILTFTVPMSALASGRMHFDMDDENDDIIYVDEIRQTAVTNTEAIDYEVYELSGLPGMSKNDVVKNSIKDFCLVDQTIENGNMPIILYSSSVLNQYLYNCEEIVEISEIADCLYINYCTLDGKEIILCYNDIGLFNKSIYDPFTDIAIIEVNNSVTRYENFRNGSYYEMSEKLLDEINRCVEEEDWAALRKLPGLSVTIDQNEIVSIEPQCESSEISNIGKRPYSINGEGLRTESELLSHLQSKWPPYTNKSMLMSFYTSSALKKNVDLKVTESRNGYTKKSADLRNFTVGTAVTTIATVLGPTSSAIAIILTALGVAISAANEILNAVKLYRSAVYQYTGQRKGYAYDTTAYRDYVRVIHYSGKGEFTGGYLSDGTFNWVHSTVSTAFNNSYESIKTKTASNYEADVYANGYCSLYSPE